jgi:hypothetical protein
MHRPILLLVLAVSTFGAGCKTKTVQTPATTRQGIALVTQAKLLNGPTVSATDAQTGLQFTSVLPPTFNDDIGKYTTERPGEIVQTQVGVGGTLAEDAALLRQQPGLDKFEDGMLGNWKVTAAFDSRSSRWVVRAVQADKSFPDQAYDVIECLSIPSSSPDFWDGCRTIVENGAVNRSQVDIKGVPKN